MTDPDIWMDAIAANAPQLREALADARLPTDDLTEDGRRFFRFSMGRTTVAFGGIELYEASALLRSFVVLPGHRDRGIGQAVMQKLLDKARDGGASAAYLLTDTAAPFFKACGFEEIERDAAPNAILATRQATSICPASAALMAMDLKR
ncbi:arsenic resistance N-acetyltransferase ArsN2 [Rhizobium calliandrae]|uniref:Arsenic resistance N-acetyltransferase ArsN2 n=1 Tax=Rhizobium calliandrae TaxID=1312182 RepID=A0ABT7KNI8_9HYPH|nr:arsenic resistance N-acetyltransferase ArsN2 [Rhizobium calliandrae]MDL2408814.1 arsenic resistance N-acetyltransferase ArsN2 [Rhizobium calliandrae]